MAASAISNIENSLTASYVSPSGCMYYGTTFNIFNIESTATAYPINVSFENMAFKYLFYHSFD